MVLPPQHDPRQYAKRDPLSFAKGAFEALTLMLKDIKVVRQEALSQSQVRSLARLWASYQDVRASDYSSKDKWLKAIYRDAQYKFQSSPILLLCFSLLHRRQVTTINASAGVGGGAHEAGHAICGCANGRFPTMSNFALRSVATSI